VCDAIYLPSSSDERRRSPMSRPKTSLSGSRRSATSVHRFVRMRFLYFTHIGFRSLAFYSMGSHFAPSGDQKFFRYPRQTTIINHRVPSFTSAGVLQALAIPKFSNKCQLCRENEPSNLRPLFHLISKAISVPKWHRPIYKLWIAALAYK